MIYNEIQVQKCPPVGRYRGSVVLISAVFAAFLSAGVAFSLAKLHASTMKTLETSKVNIEAQQYGLAKAEYLRSTAYDALVSQDKQNILSSAGFKDEVVVGSEEPYNDKLNQKVCTINVYKDDEKLPRFSYKVSKLSSGSDSSNSVPKGTILPWYGSSDSVPNGYALCDGQNGTPDLRGRFLVGVNGSTYKLGSKGGEEKHQLINDELPKKSVDIMGWIPVGFLHHHYAEKQKWEARLGDTSSLLGLTKATSSNVDFKMSFDSSLGNCYGSVYYSPISSALSSGNDQPHENRPPYFAVQYIMKL